MTVILLVVSILHIAVLAGSSLLTPAGQKPSSSGETVIAVVLPVSPRATPDESSINDDSPPEEKQNPPIIESQEMEPPSPAIIKEAEEANLIPEPPRPLLVQNEYPMANPSKARKKIPQPRNAGPDKITKPQATPEDPATASLPPADFSDEPAVDATNSPVASNDQTPLMERDLSATVDSPETTAFSARQDDALEESLTGEPDLKDSLGSSLSPEENPASESMHAEEDVRSSQKSQENQEYHEIRGGDSQKFIREKLTDFQGQVAKKIHMNTLYPRQARRDRIQGTATVRFIIRPDGRAIQPSVIKSAGHQMLDDAAIQTVTSGSPYLPFPGGIHQPIGVTVKIHFKLDR